MWRWLARRLGWCSRAPSSVVQSRAFFESVEFGDTVAIVRNGPISIEAKCEGNLEIEPGIFIDRIRLLAVTTVPGTAAQLESGFLPNNVGVFLNPSTEREWSRRFADVERSAGNPAYQNERDDGSVVAPSGEVILIDGETLGLGLNIFDSRLPGGGHFIKPSTAGSEHGVPGPARRAEVDGTASSERRGAATSPPWCPSKGPVAGVQRLRDHRGLTRRPCRKIARELGDGPVADHGTEQVANAVGCFMGDFEAGIAHLRRSGNRPTHSRPHSAAGRSGSGLNVERKIRRAVRSSASDHQGKSWIGSRSRSRSSLPSASASASGELRKKSTMLSRGVVRRS